MPLQGQQRALAILFGVFGGGLLIAFLAVTLIDGDDKGKNISVGPNQPSTSTSTSTTFPPTLPPTLPPTTLPPTPGTVVTPSTGVTPGTVIVVPTTSPPAPTTTGGTTATTSPPSVAQQIETLLEDALLFGEPPADPPPPPRVEAAFRRHVSVRVTWTLDPTLSEEEQKYTAREEATAILAALQAFSEVTDERIILRATLPDEDDQPKRVIRLVFEPATWNAIDFSTFDPLTIFEVADDADIDPILEPTPPATTTSSSTTTTTS